MEPAHEATGFSPPPTRSAAESSGPAAGQGGYWVWCEVLYKYILLLCLVIWYVTVTKHTCRLTVSTRSWTPSELGTHSQVMIILTFLVNYQADKVELDNFCLFSLDIFTGVRGQVTGVAARMESINI